MTPHIPNIDKYIMPAIDPQSNVIQKFKAVAGKLIAKINRIALRLSGNSLEGMSNKKLLESFGRHISQLQEGCTELILQTENVKTAQDFKLMIKKTESITKQTLAAQKVIRKIEGKFGEAMLEHQLEWISKDLNLLADTIKFTLKNKIDQTEPGEVDKILKELDELNESVKKGLLQNCKCFSEMATGERLETIFEEQNNKFNTLAENSWPYFSGNKQTHVELRVKINEIRKLISDLKKTKDITFDIEKLSKFVPEKPGEKKHFKRRRNDEKDPPDKIKHHIELLQIKLNAISNKTLTDLSNKKLNSIRTRWKKTKISRKDNTWYFEFPQTSKNKKRGA